MLQTFNKEMISFPVVPPDIVDSDSSTDTVVREGSNASLTCAARGHPQPHILWRREDGASITKGKLKGTLFFFGLFSSFSFNCLCLLFFVANAFDGEVLALARVSRLHIGAYLCIASNGVPPSVSKRIVLNVQCNTYTNWVLAEIFHKIFSPYSCARFVDS